MALGILILAGLSLPALAVDVSGTWEMTAQAQRGDWNSEMKIKQDGEKITVTMEGFQGDEMKGEGTIKENKVEWTVTISTQGGDLSITYTGTVEGDINNDPLFMDVSDLDPVNWDLHLQSSSPCIDMGNNDAPAIPDFDIEGNPRRIDGDNDGTATADMGAYEYVPDADGDGIYDVIDSDPTTFSNDFSDVALDPPGTTTGTILDRGDQTLVVTEEPNPAGVRIRALSSVGPTAATVRACGGFFDNISVDGVDDFFVRCGSASAEVLVGPVEILLPSHILVTVPSEATVRVTEVAEGQLEIENSGSTGTIIVEFRDQVIELDPGESTFVEVGVCQLCSYLGDDTKPSILDQDIFKFTGTEGETVTIRLETDPPEAGSGKWATLIVKDRIRGVWLFEMDRSVLPNEISVTLPASGKYLIIVAEQPRFARGERYRGGYCLILEASPETCQTLELIRSVE